MRQSRAALAAAITTPRLPQESRLQQLDDLLACKGVEDDAIATEIERTVLLAALNRRPDAREALVAILRRAPTNFSALNELGNLLTDIGAIDAACRVYWEAIQHHPDHPMARVNLANPLLRANKHAEAREHYEAALRIDPDHAPAHQGLGAVFSDLGERDRARRHFEKGFRGHAVSSLPYRGAKPPVALLRLVSSGGGNIPTAPFLDDCIFLTTVIVTDHLDPSTPLPPHQLIFNAIRDADLCQPALEAALGAKAIAALEGIRDTLGLDYAGIDFGLSPDGEVRSQRHHGDQLTKPRRTLGVSPCRDRRGAGSRC